MSRAALYLRVSSEGQTDKFGLDLQRRACLDYAARAGLTVGETYQDVISGTRESRAGFDALIRDAGGYGHVVLYATDRLARAVPVAYTLLAQLAKAGLTVHSALEGPLTLEDDSSALSFGIRAVIADAERRRITARMQAGKLEKIKGGQTLRPVCGYGYRDGQPLEDQARWVRWMYQNALEKGTNALAAQLNTWGVPAATQSQWSRSSVVAILKNPTYRGEYHYGRSGLVVPVPPLVDADLWHQVQLALAGRKRNSRRPGELSGLYELQGLLRCRACGGVMSGYRSARAAPRNVYYHCRNAHEKRCAHRRYYRIETVHEGVRAALERLTRGQDLSALEVAASVPAPSRLDAQRVALERERERWKRAYAAEIISLDEFAVEKDRIDRALSALSAAPLESAPTLILPALERLANQLEGHVGELLRGVGLTVRLGEGGILSFVLER